MLSCYFQREKFLILSRAYRNAFIYTKRAYMVGRFQNVFIPFAKCISTDFITKVYKFKNTNIQKFYL